MPLLSKQGIQNGLIVSASHVSDIVDALTHLSNKDVLISGSLAVGTSITGSDKVRISGNLNVIGPITASNLNVSGLISGSSLNLSNSITASNLNINNWNSAYSQSIRSLVSSSATSSWDTAYNKSIVSASISGSASKILYIGLQNGSSVTASFTDLSASGSTEISGSNKYLTVFSSGSRKLIEATGSYFRESDNKLIISGSMEVVEGFSVKSGTSSFGNNVTFNSSSIFFAPIQIPVYFHNSDSDFTIPDYASIIVLNAQLTVNRTIYFNHDFDKNHIGRQIFIINRNASPTYSWAIGSTTAVDLLLEDTDGQIYYTTLTRVTSFFINIYDANDLEYKGIILQRILL